jgi:hypothetical protein
MTAKTPSQLITSFENGDVPVQADYQDIFDSYVNLAQTTSQSMAGDLNLPNLTAANTVSANNVNVTNAVNATIVSASVINAAFGNFTAVTAQTIVASAATFNVVSNSADTSVRAVGTTQGGAKALTAMLNRVVSGSAADNNGVILSQITGRHQLVFNDTNINIKVYPGTGGQIDDLATNVAYTVSASAAIGFYYLGSNIYLSK